MFGNHDDRIQCGVCSSRLYGINDFYKQVRKIANAIIAVHMASLVLILGVLFLV